MGGSNPGGAFLFCFKINTHQIPVQLTFDPSCGGLNEGGSDFCLGDAGYCHSGHLLLLNMI